MPCRFTVFHQGDPLSEEGTSHIEPIRIAAADAIKGTPLEGSTVYVGGSAAMYKDMQQGADYDLLIAAVAALILIFLIMVVLTRAIAAAAVIVGTVVLSLGASFGLSVLLWQHLIGLPLHWMVLPMSVIVLLAVGADYNLLLVSRMKEEIHAGLHTGMIRAMAGTGSVVTTAGLVFAFTMASMAVSNLIVIGQVGTTIGLGLLFDTLVVRSLMTPSLAALLGRWFWWPQRVRPRPVPQPWPKVEFGRVTARRGVLAPPPASARVCGRHAAKYQHFAHARGTSCPPIGGYDFHPPHPPVARHTARSNQGMVISSPEQLRSHTKGLMK